MPEFFKYFNKIIDLKERVYERSWITKIISAS